MSPGSADVMAAELTEQPSCLTVVLVGGGLSVISLGSSPLATTISNTHVQATLFCVFKAEVLHTTQGLLLF